MAVVVVEWWWWWPCVQGSVCVCVAARTGRRHGLNVRTSVGPSKPTYLYLPHSFTHSQTCLLSSRQPEEAATSQPQQTQDIYTTDTSLWPRRGHCPRGKDTEGRRRPPFPGVVSGLFCRSPWLYGSRVGWGWGRGPSECGDGVRARRGRGGEGGGGRDGVGEKVRGKG